MLGIEVAHSIPSLRVIRVMEQLIELHGKPRALRLDNGPELITATAFTEWCAVRGIEARFIQPGKPDQNAFIERFNKTYRDEVLDAYVFDSIEQVREVTETWLREYNEERPHDSLGRVPPLTFMPRPTVGRESRTYLKCAVQRHGLSAGASPARQLSLQPVVIGAVVEVTKRLKPSM